MHEDDQTFIGNRAVWGGESPALIRRRDRRQHLYAVGKTGTGKSTLLERLILQDIANGEGVALLDPHGQTAERLLDFIPPWRTDDLCYFDPSDLAHPIGLNILSGHAPELAHLVVSDVVSVFSAIWGLSFRDTPQLLYILRNAVAALLHVPDATLLHIKRLLIDEAYRARVADRLPQNGGLATYWQTEFPMRGKTELAAAIAPVLNKVGEWDITPMMRNIIGQPGSAFDPRFMMDNRRILIANLAKGKIGEENANLLGSLLVSRFQLAAATRADIPEEERADFYLYADEFQNFATDSFAGILSEARKHRLCLSLFHQYLDQLGDLVRDAVFGNVGTLIAFRVGQRDAERLAKEFEYAVEPSAFTGLDRYEVMVRLLESGAYADPFSARTTLPEATRHGERANMIAQSRMRFGRPRERVERSLDRTFARRASASKRAPLRKTETRERIARLKVIKKEIKNGKYDQVLDRCEAVSGCSKYPLPEELEPILKTLWREGKIDHEGHVPGYVGAFSSVVIAEIELEQVRLQSEL